MPSTPAALALENYIQDFETSVYSSDASSCAMCYVPEVSDGCKREQVQVRTAAGRATPRPRHSTGRCLPSMEMPDLTDITTLGGGGLSSPQPEDMLSSVAVDMSPVSASVAAAPRSTQRSRRGSPSTRKHPRSKGPKSRKSTSSSQGGSKSTGLRKKKTQCVRTSASDSGTVAASLLGPWCWASRAQLPSRKVHIVH